MLLDYDALELRGFEPGAMVRLPGGGGGESGGGNRRFARTST
jgi:hypothetical protein